MKIICTQIVYETITKGISNKLGSTRTQKGNHCSVSCKHWKQYCFIRKTTTNFIY